MISRLQLPLIIQFAFVVTGCSPAPQVDYRISMTDDSKLRSLVEKNIGIPIPESALIIEALTNGGRNPDFWCLLSCDSATSQKIETTASERIGRRAAWISTETWDKKFIEDYQIPKQFHRYFAIAKLLPTRTILYSFSDSRNRFQDGILILFIPDRAWVIFYYQKT